MDIYSSYNKEIESIRGHDFPNLTGSTYVEHVGATLYARSQIEAYQKDLMSNLYGNPHSRSQSSRLATDAIDQVRYRILSHFNTCQDEYSIIFTPSCTAALKLIAESFNFDPELQTNEISDAQSHDIEKNKSYQSDGVCSSSDTECVQSESDKCDINKKGCFCYLLDNHTSVQGMRELIVQRAVAILCLDEHQLDRKEFPTSTILNKIAKYAAPANCLFAYPAESNFSGHKYPLTWIEKVKNSELGFQENFPGQWYTILDAAAFVGTSILDLNVYKPDFVPLSFYKMFGFPTGIGALLVRNQAAHTLQKKYFGGGTVAVSAAAERFHKFRPNLAERFEDGTLPFLDIIALHHGFDALNQLGGGMLQISRHTFVIGQFFHHHLDNLRHGNGQPVAEIYCEDTFDDITTQGAVINFNLKRFNGEYIGFAEVDKMSQLYNIHLRTGCFCNIGACQKYLNITSQQIKKNYQAGHVCGDDRDLIDGRPTGSVRVSFGYMSTIKDAQICLLFIVECFIEGLTEKPTFSFEENTAKSSNDSYRKSRDNPLDSASVLPQTNVETVNNVETMFWGKDQRSYSEPELEEISADRVATSTGVVTMEIEHILQSCTADVRRLTNIYLYPIKSCGACEVSNWQIGAKGLLYDRDWMIVSENGVAVSQKREPRLCLIRPKVDLMSQNLILRMEDMDPLEVPLDSSATLGEQETAATCSSKVCMDRVLGIDCGDTAADWISEALQRPGCRLVQQNRKDRRKSQLKDVESAEKDLQTKLSLANQSQYLMICRPSVELLQNKITERQTEFNETLEDIDIENLIQRFRGNLVIGGGRAFDEDLWNTVNIGEYGFVSQGGCSRCPMVCLDQKTGCRSKEPLRTLASWRGGKIPFGIHLRNGAIKPGARLCVGDPIDVII